jgi:Na+/H+ antiporter NhaD/arsenite permease-like protein
MFGPIIGFIRPAGMPSSMEICVSVLVLAVVFALIAVRQVGSFRLKIWQIMTGGALVVLLTGQIGPLDALQAIDVDVMLFLLGMFIVGSAMQESGLLYHLAHRLFRRAASVDRLVLLLLFSFGMLSAVLMNDTIAIIGTPLVLHYARTQNVSAKMLLLALAFSVTIGSAMSPIGNPQNLLIAMNGGIPDPFSSFLSALLLPTIVNLLIAYAILRIFFRGEFGERPVCLHDDGIADARLARLCMASLVIIAVMIAAKILLAALRPEMDFPLTLIALTAAAPIVILSPRRVEVVKRSDWPTLIFFASMFVLMAAVWASGFFQSMLGGAESLTSVPMILLVSVVLSQFISNVPFAALYVPLLQDAGAGATEMIALAAGSTIAGNLLLLGAASNIIVVQGAEREGETLTFLEFAKVGVPLTALNCLVYWFFLSL